MVLLVSPQSDMNRNTLVSEDESLVRRGALTSLASKSEWKRANVTSPDNDKNLSVVLRSSLRLKGTEIH